MSGGALHLTIIGAGRLARALAGALAGRRGVRLTVAARRPARARAIAARSGAAPAASVRDAVAAARVLLLAVSDRSIAPLAREIAGYRRSWRGVVVLHAAGALGPGPLAPLARRGASTGVLHPLAVLGASGERALAGAAARIEGAARARAAARSIASLAGMRPLRSGALGSDRARAAYHAAASLAANDLVALLDLAETLLVRHGVAPREARRALGHLARGVIDQIETHGTAGALTGPAARGDADTVRRQMKAVLAVDRDVTEAHRAISLRLARLGRGRGKGRGV